MIFLSSALAIGYLVGSMKHGGFTTDINSLMFGSIVFANQQDFIIMLVTSILVIGTFILLYHRIFSVTFDESFAKATGIHTRLFNILVVGINFLKVIMIG